MKSHSMTTPSKSVDTVAIIARQTAFGNDLVTAAVTMTAAAWDRLTAGYKGFNRWVKDDPGIPDISLDERIAEFLTAETMVWEYDGCETHFDADLDGDVPF